MTGYSILHNIFIIAYLLLICRNHVDANRKEFKGALFSKEYFGVSYSPFAKSHEIVDGKEVTANILSYTSEYVNAQVKLLSENVAFAGTFGMGSSDADLSKPWEEGFPISALISRAAAFVNRNASSVKIRIIQGIYQNSNAKLMKLEIETAMKAVTEANKIFPGTVTGFCVFDWAEDSEEKIGEIERAIKLIKSDRRLSELKFGTFSYTCRNVELEDNETLKVNFFRVAEKLDFLYCGNFPQGSELFSGPESAVNTTMTSYLIWRKIIRKIHPHIDVVSLGGWPSKGVSFTGNSTTNKLNNTVRYWELMNDWAVEHKIPVILFQPFDEPLKASPLNLNPTDPSGRWGAEGHYGFWKLKDNNDPYSLIPKYEDLTEFEALDPVSTVKSTDSSNNQGKYLLVTGVSGLIIVALFFGFFIYKKCWRENHLIIISKEEVNAILYGSEHAEETTGGSSVSVPYAKSKYEKSVGSFSFQNNCIIGKGNFGIVYSGFLICNGENVAIKTINMDNSDVTSAIRFLLREVKILSYLGLHPNVVEMLAASTNSATQGKVFLALKLYKMGNLQKYLQQNENVYKKQLQNDKDKTQVFLKLVKWAWEISTGMEYLETKYVIHGDLATRNILLDDNLTAKLSDFGLSKRLYVYNEYIKTDRNQELPWRWMAPEVIGKMKYSIKSDVWSFGVTLWEIFTLGLVPFSDMNWSVDFARQLEQGLRLPDPEFANDTVLSLLQDCWKLKPSLRPCFSHITPVLVKIIRSMSTHVKNAEVGAHVVNLKSSEEYEFAPAESI